jgi:hypothetical protein
MHTEHLQNVRLSMVVAGWLVAIAVTSLVVFVFQASGFGSFGSGVADALASLIAVVVGFAAGGFFAGFRARSAPILTGAGMGITSIAAWVLVNALATGLGLGEWTGLDATAALGLVLAQMAAAVIGALVGYNIALRGKPGLSEDIPGA